MGSIYDRLKEIKYQVIKNLETPMTDKQKVSAVRSIYDAAIDEPLPEGIVLPSEIMGVSLNWSEDNSSFVASLNAVIMEDNLTDEYVPSIDSFLNSLFVNGEVLLVNGENLELVA